MSFKPSSWLARASWVFIFAAVCGCPLPDDDEPQPSATTLQGVEKPQKLKLLSIDDPQQVAARLAQLWRAQTSGETDVSYATSSELFVDGTPSIPECDLVIYPAVFLGEMLAREAIQPLDSSILKEYGADRRSLLKHDRTTVVQSGSLIYGTSLGSPILMMLFRQDVLDQLQLEPPETWSQYRSLLESLNHAGSDLKNAEGDPLPTQVWEPTSGNWLGEYLLARTAGSLVRQGRLSSYFDIETMKPLINTPPFVDSLEQLVAQRTITPERLCTPEEAYRALVGGQAAVALCWPSCHPTVEDATKQYPISVAPLPGANRSYDYRDEKWNLIRPDEVRSTALLPLVGRIGSISQKSRKLRTALRWQAWIMLPEINRDITPQFSDLLLTQSSQLTDPYRWVNDQLPREAAQQMADVLRECHDRSPTMSNLRIPGRDAYMQILSDAARSALAGSASPQAALDSAAVSWAELTNRLGHDRQMKLYQDSVRSEF